MTVKESSLTVQTPIPQKHLSRYRNKTGVYLIRRNDQVIYIGSAKNIYKAVMRLFQKGGILQQINRHRLTFEIIETNLCFLNVQTVLKRQYSPPKNRRINLGGEESKYQKRRNRRILDAYLSQTRFEVKANHKTDS